jgi:putative redox protein
VRGLGCGRIYAGAPVRTKRLAARTMHAGSVRSTVAARKRCDAGAIADRPQENRVTRIVHTVLDSAEHYACRITSGKHQITADEPVAVGGTDSGPSPYQLFLSGLAACTSITLRMYADRKGWKLGTIHVDLELHKEGNDDTGKIKRVISFSEPLSAEQRSKLLEISEKTPVTRTVKAGAPITTELG